MKIFSQTKKLSLPKRLLRGVTAFFFFGSTILPNASMAQIPQTVLNLPVPGTMFSLSPSFTPTMIKGMTIYPDDPFKFDFIIDKGDTTLEGEDFKAESAKLIKYFLASLTTSEEKMWVNLSPYEKDRIIADGFDTTEMGRDLLAQDYILKQLTASLLYPENELGKSFWNKVYAQAQEKLGTNDIPMNTFNKVWIIPERAEVYVHGKSAFVVGSHLKVMLEEDYLGKKIEDGRGKIEDTINPSSPINLPSSLMKAIIIPEIEKEINEGQNFAQLRQIYNSLILATWYKKNLKKSLFGQVYIDKNKTKGVDVEDKQIKQKIYDQYLAAFKKGAYDYIKEDYNPETQEVVSKKYFSGGVDYKQLREVQKEKLKLNQRDFASLSKTQSAVVTTRIRTTTSNSNPDIQTTQSPYVFDPDNMKWVETNLVQEINEQRIDSLVDDFIKHNDPKDFDYYIFSLMQHIRKNGLHRESLQGRYFDLRGIQKTLPQFVNYFVRSQEKDKNLNSILIPANPSKNRLALTKRILHLWIIAGSMDPLIYPDTTDQIALDNKSLERLQGISSNASKEQWLIGKSGEKNVYNPEIDQPNSRQHLMLILKKVISKSRLKTLLQLILNTNFQKYGLPPPSVGRSMVFFYQLDRFDDPLFADTNFLDYLMWNDVFTAEVSKERMRIYRDTLEKDVVSLDLKNQLVDAAMASESAFKVAEREFTTGQFVYYQGREWKIGKKIERMINGIKLEGVELISSNEGMEPLRLLMPADINQIKTEPLTEDYDFDEDSDIENLNRESEITKDALEQQIGSKKEFKELSQLMKLLFKSSAYDQSAMINAEVLLKRLTQSVYESTIKNTFLTTDAKHLIGALIEHSIPQTKNVVKNLEKNQSALVKLPLDMDDLIKVIASSEERNLGVFQNGPNRFIWIVPGTPYISGRAEAPQSPLDEYAVLSGHSHPLYSDVNPSDEDNNVALQDEEDGKDHFIIVAKSVKEVEVNLFRNSRFQMYQGEEAKNILRELGIIKSSDAAMKSDASKDNREGWGFSIGSLTAKQSEYAAKLRSNQVLQTEFVSLNDAEIEKIVNALVRFKDKSLELRPELFNAEDIKAILNYEAFDVGTFAKKILTEKTKYEAKKDNKGNQLFSDRQIEEVLYQKLTPLQWIEELMEAGLNKSEAFILATHQSNPKQAWVDKKQVRNELVTTENLSPSDATRAVLNWANPTEEWAKRKSIRNELVDDGLIKSVATFTVIGWKNAKKEWAKRKLIRNELVDGGLIKSEATRTIFRWANPTEEWAKRKPIRNELVKDGLTKTDATRAVLVWANAEKEWASRKSIRDELLGDDLIRSDATRAVLRWVKPKEKIAAINEAILNLKMALPELTESYLRRWLITNSNKSIAQELKQTYGKNDDEISALLRPLQKYEKNFGQQKTDSATLGENPGGIDLNPNKMNLQITGEDSPLYAPVDPAVLENMININGAYPVIINVAPVTNLQLLLGIADPNPQKDKPTEVSYNVSSLR